AVYELTRPDKREENPPRYELRGDVRDLCWQLLGPPPEKEDAFWCHPDGTPMERPQAQAEPEKKARKPRDRDGNACLDRRSTTTGDPLQRVTVSSRFSHLENRCRTSYPPLSRAVVSRFLMGQFQKQ